MREELPGRPPAPNHARMIETPRPGLPRLILFASGDFAFNLYWQSVMLYLLFYYSDALGLGIEAAATTYLVASVWDGIVSFAAGLVAERSGSPDRYRWALIAGGVPLGLAFMLAYTPPPVVGAGAVAWVLATHLVFRTAYALVNVPYLAMSAQVSAHSRDRSTVAGLRMLFGSGAAVIVAFATVPIGRWMMGDEGPRAFLASAALFAAVAAVLIVLVGMNFRDTAGFEHKPILSLRRALVLLARNRAFVTLNLAMMAMIVAVTILSKSVLYYFKYVVQDEGAGQLALASMMAVSTLAVPLWMGVARLSGARIAWLAAIAINMVALAVFASVDIVQAGRMQLFLIVSQAATVGLHFGYWALLPDTIEYGQRQTGERVEGTVFGLASLLQRIAIGIATAIMGWSFWGSGYTANVAQSAATVEGMRLTIALVPLGFLALAAAVMWLNPLRKGAHDRIVAELAD